LSTESDQVKSLQQAILERARELADEHVSQGEMTRAKIIEDAREKIKLMEQKELLAARLLSEREYQRRLVELRNDEAAYRPLFERLLRQAVDSLDAGRLVATLGNEDLARFHDDWEDLVSGCCGSKVKVRLSPEACQCSGGLRLRSDKGDIMIDNTFEGIISRREDELQRLIFERLFSTVSTKGTVFDG
jgi:V/A-type H+-transporting ATPase subunit E